MTTPPPAKPPREPYLDEEHLYNKYQEMKAANERNLAEKFEALKQWKQTSALLLQERNRLTAELADVRKERDAFKYAADQNCIAADTYRALAEKLAGALEKIDCLCDAQFSGRDEAEYCARGCPSCSCEHIEALAAYRAWEKERGR